MGNDDDIDMTEAEKVLFYAYEQQPTGPDGRYIRDRLMPEFWEQFARKAADYNDNENENHRALGVRGQFADIWRKIGKLKKALWEGRSLAGEQPREILMDLIAHCFLTIAMMDADPGDGTPSQPAVLVPKQEASRLPPPGLKESGGSEVLWPACGRERCINHPKVKYSELEALGVTIYPGKPQMGTTEVGAAGEMHHG